MVDKVKLAAAVRGRRGGHSYRKAAGEAGVSYETIRAVERQELTPTLDVFMKLCRWMGVDGTYFYAETHSEAV